MLCIIVGKLLGIQNTLIEVPNVVDQTTAACAFSIANVESAFIVKFFAVPDNIYENHCFFVPTGTKFRNISFLVLLFVQKLQHSVGQSEACIRVVFDKVFK